MIRLRMDGQSVNVHSSVLQKRPYFATLLSDTWNDADIVKLNLPEPCGLSDFLALLEYDMAGGRKFSKLPTVCLSFCLRDFLSV